MQFQKKFFSFFTFVVSQILFMFSNMCLEAHWHHDHVYVVDQPVVVAHPWYHRDHVVVVEGNSYPKYYGGRPYYYYSPQYYYDPAPAPVVVEPAAAVNLNVNL